MKKVLSEFLIAQDHFGITPAFLHKGRNQYNTFLCKIFSLLMNLGCISIFITKLIELTKKSNPTVNHVSLWKSMGPNNTLNSNTFVASFGILDQNNILFHDPSYLTLEAYYEIGSIENGNYIVTKNKLNPINCTEINYNVYKKYGFEEEFHSNILSNFYCFNSTEYNDEIVIGGIYGHDFYGCIHAILQKCQNSSNSDIICKTEKEIDSKINGFWFEFFFIDQFIDIYNYTQPIQTFGNSLYTWVTPDFSKSIKAYFNQVTVYSDNGILFDSIKESIAFKYDQNTYDVKANNQDGKLVEFSIISSRNDEKYYRSYIKIQDVFATVGGIFNGLIIGGSIVFGYFGAVKYQKELIKSLFNFSVYKGPRKNIIGDDLIKNELTYHYTVDKINSGKKSQIKDARYKPLQFNLKLIDLVCINYKWYKSKRIRYFKREFNKIQQSMKEKLEFSSTILFQHNVQYIQQILIEMQNIPNWKIPKQSKYLWILEGCENHRRHRKSDLKDKKERKETNRTINEGEITEKDQDSFKVQEEIGNKNRVEMNKKNTLDSLSSKIERTKNNNQNAKSHRKEISFDNKYCIKCGKKLDKNNKGICNKCQEAQKNRSVS